MSKFLVRTSLHSVSAYGFIRNGVILSVLKHCLHISQLMGQKRQQLIVVTINKSFLKFSKNNNNFFLFFLKIAKNLSIIVSYKTILNVCMWWALSAPP
jgi:hypothetical protein